MLSTVIREASLVAFERDKEVVFISKYLLESGCCVGWPLQLFMSSSGRSIKGRIVDVGFAGADREELALLSPRFARVGVAWVALRQLGVAQVARGVPGVEGGLALILCSADDLASP